MGVVILCFPLATSHKGSEGIIAQKKNNKEENTSQQKVMKPKGEELKFT